MNEKKISVVIPVHNSEGTLSGCLEGLFKTGYKNFEVIVVDDFSSDKSIEIAKKYPCKIVSLPERRGPAFARDKGLSSTSGEIVAFLDSDCIAQKGWLSKINARLKSDIAGIGGRYSLPQSANGISSLFMAAWDFKNFLYSKPRGLISLSGGNCAFWKSALVRQRKKAELVYCNKQVGGDDTLMCCELSRFGRLVYDPDICVVHNKQSSLPDIMKEAINLGVSGRIVTGLCGKLLIREPHRVYKTILYIMSMALFLTAPAFPLWNVPQAYLGFIILYITAQLPLIFLGANYLSGKNYRFLFPVITFIDDLLHFIGNVKGLMRSAKRTIRSLIWHIKVFLNAMRPSALFRIFFFVTKKCNATCYFCFNKDASVALAEKDLSLEEIKKISANMGFLPWLTITGGEPFLRKDIYEIFRTFYLNCGTRIISIVTNGTSPGSIEDVVERILMDCDGLNLTVITALDDIGEKHDRIKGIEGCYGLALETLERLKSLRSRFPRLTLGINTTIIKENASRIEEVLDYYGNNLSYDRQCLNLLRKPPGGGDDEGLIPIQRYVELVKSKTFQEKAVKKNHSIKQRFNRALLEHIGKKSLENFKAKKDRNICLAAQKFFVIDNNGDLFACELSHERLGNLRDANYDLKRLITNSKIKKFRKKIRAAGCHCLWPCAAATNAYLRPSSYPKILTNMRPLSR